MTETEFRAKHSEIIEYYQYIEMHLKGICAAILKDKERSWFEKLNDYETDPFGKLVKEIKVLQSQRNIVLFSQMDLEALEELRQKRNYWVHQCFSDHSPVIFRKGELRNPVFSERIESDLRDAIMWDEKITEIERPLISAQH